MSRHDPTDIGARERAENERERDSLLAAAAVRAEVELQLSTPIGRRQVWREIEPVFRSVFNTNAMQMANLEGRRGAALDKFETIIALFPDRFLEMRRENIQ